jgi:TolA-binding protein
MKSFFISGRIFRSFVLSMVCLSCFLPAAYSAESTSAQAQATSVLIQDVEGLLASGLYKKSADYLQEILIRLEASTDTDSLATRASCLYQLGVCQLKSDDPAGAAESFRKFIAEFPRDELVPMARFMVLEAYARQNDQAKMTAWLAELKSSGAFDELSRFLSDEKNADFRRNAVLALVMNYAEQGDLDNLRVFLPFCDDSVLADAGLNTALIEGGDKAFDAKAYARALVLYRMVLMKEELIPVYDKQVAGLTAELAKELPWVPLKERDRQAADRQADQDRLDGLKQTIQFFNESGYDLDLLIRMAQCYDAMQRYRQSLAVYSRIYNGFPEHRLAEQSRASAFQALLALDEQAEALIAGRDYLERYPQGRFEDEVIVSLMQLYLTRSELSASAELGQHAMEALPNRRLADQITYLLGITFLQQQRWPEAFDLFAQVKEKWPQGIYVQDADYWGCMCYLFEGRFAEAVPAFKSYLTNPNYVPARFSAEATYRLGVSQYGVEDFTAAEGTFKEFLILYPDSSLVSEAYSMLGDLRGADGDLDTALTLYQTAIEKATDVEQDNYAIFQSAQVYELRQSYTEIIALMKAYITRQGAKARLADAGLWIGKSCKAQGDRKQAMEIYLKTLVDYGNDPSLDGVDQVLTQILNDLKDGAGIDDVTFAKTRLTEELTLARQKNERALALRLTAVLARLTGEPERGRYVAALQEEKELAVFSPLPMIVLAESFSDLGDIQSVDEIATEFQTRFSGSEQLVDMLNMEAAACLSAKQYEKTIALTDEALNRFDGDARTGLSRKLQADAFRLSGRWAKAIETYQKIFSIRTSHGSLAPETLYWIGICKREQGETEKAFAFFQRIYVLYKGYPEWVAKAYEASAECLEKLGRTDEMIQTLQEMVAIPALQNTPEAQKAAGILRKLNKEVSP